MTGNEVKEAAEMYIGINIDDDDAILVINEALDAISDTGLCYGETQVDAEADLWYFLPVDLTNILNVTIEGNIYKDYEQYGDRIRFNHTGEYTILARKVPEHIEEIGDTLDVHPMFRRAVVLYLRGWFKVRDNDQSQDGHRLMQQFEESVVKAYTMLRRQRRPAQVRVIRHA